MPRVKASARTELADRPSQIKLLRRRLRRFARPLALLVGAGTLVVALSAFSAEIDPRSNLASWREEIGAFAAQLGWRVRRVEVSGRIETPSGLIAAALGVKRGDSLLGFSLAAARKRLEALPSVRTAVIERMLPGTLIVRLTERRPFAVWQHDGKFSVIDRQGRILAHQNVAAVLRRTGNLPLVVGAGAETEAWKLIEDLRRFPAIERRLAAASWIGGRRWNLLLRNRITVELPERGTGRALARLMSFERRIALLDRPVKIVDLRLSEWLVVLPYPTPSSPHSGASAPAGKS